jgi:hypothetical protein
LLEKSSNIDDKKKVKTPTDNVNRMIIALNGLDLKFSQLRYVIIFLNKLSLDTDNFINIIRKNGNKLIMAEYR